MALPKLKGLNGNVLVEPIKKTEKTTNTGIILPEVTSKASRGRLERATVVMVEEGERVNIGEIVYYQPGAGNEIILDAKPYLIIPILHLKLAEVPA